MKKIFVILSIISFLGLACAKHDVDNRAKLPSFNIEMGNAAMKVIEARCASCHGPDANSGGVGNLMDPQHLMNKGLIIPGDSNQGRLVGSMVDKSMPIGATMTDEEIQVVRTWIDLGFDGANPPPIPPAVNIDGSPLQIEALTIVQNRCAGCHGGPNGSAGISNIINVKHLLSSGLVVQGDPSQGRLMGSIYDGTMPTAGPLPATEVATLEAWITTDIDPNAQSELPPPEPIQATFASIYEKVLVPKCVACHGPDKAEDDYRYDSYEYTMGIIGKDESSVRPGDAQESKFYKEVISGSMPPAADGYQPLAQDEIVAIRNWINAGALNN